MNYTPEQMRDFKRMAILLQAGQRGHVHARAAFAHLAVQHKQALTDFPADTLAGWEPTEADYEEAAAFARAVWDRQQRELRTQAIQRIALTVAAYLAIIFATIDLPIGLYLLNMLGIVALILSNI